MSTTLKREKLSGKLFLISGPSGVGKGTVIRELKKVFNDAFFPISSTTREIRPGEKDGEVYHFISKDAFKKGIDNGEFLEWACVHEVNYYGTLRAPIVSALEQGKIVIREVDVQGVMSITKALPDKNVVTIFIKAKNREELIQRIQHRGELPKEELERRMESADREMAQMDKFDYQVWSLQNQIPKCVEDVVEIIKKEIAPKRDKDN